MDIIELAMKMELDGKEFYLDGASDTDNEGLRKIFITLAEEEDRHFKIFKEMKDEDLSRASALVESASKTLAVVRNVFQKMADEGKTKLGGSTDRAVWTEALRIEEKSEAMYREQAENETDSDRQELWNRIADEEQTHVHLVSNIISFLTDPESYQASAQYRDFMSLEGH